MSVKPVAVLELVKGSAQGFRFSVLDEDGNPESLSGADKASLTVRTKADGGTVILQLDTVAGGLSIDVALGQLVATPTQEKADALLVGSFISAAAVHYSAGSGRWIDSDEFVTRVRPPVAAHP